MTDRIDCNATGSVTAVEMQKKQPHRYNIYVNDEYAFSAHEDVIVKYRIIKGSVLSDPLLQEALDEEERGSAYRAALRYIGPAMRSSMEIAAKLKSKGYGDEQIASVIDRLQREKYVNDGQYAETLAGQRLRSQRKGPLWIKRELRQKGIDQAQIDAVLANIDEKEERKQARALAAKRWSSDRSEPAVKRRKIVAMLQRRGFRSETVKLVINELHQAEEELWTDEYDD